MTGFPPGFSVVWHGQEYRPLGIRPHTRLDGAETALIDWETDCPICGVVFVISTSILGKEPRRRCEQCKAPGRWVKTQRRHSRRRVTGGMP